MAQKLTTKLIRGFYATDIVSDGETLTIKDPALAVEVMTQIANQRDVWFFVVCPDAPAASSAANIQTKIPVRDRCD